jgi:hypothetical protein
MSGNYFMSEAFNKDAAKAVDEAVAKADALGLPKAYSAAPELPEQPVIVKIAGATKKKKHTKTVRKA